MSPSLAPLMQLFPPLSKDLEGLPDLTRGHHGQELGEIDGAVSIDVNLVDHAPEFGRCKVLTQGAYLLSRDHVSVTKEGRVVAHREVVSDLNRIKRKPP